MVDLSLSLVLALSGLSVVESPQECDSNRALMGSYISHTNLIELCRSNVARNSQCVQQVLRHEMVHAIQENLQLKTAVIPEPLLSWMVRGLLSDSETMTVLLYDKHDTDQEFEARVLSRLPNWLIGSLLWASEYHDRAVRGGIPLPPPWQVLPVQALFWADPYAEPPSVTVAVAGS